MFSYFLPIKPSTPRVTISDLPFDVLEEILAIVLIPSPPPSDDLANGSPSGSRAGCLRTNKAFSSAGEKGLYNHVTVSKRSSWSALFGPEGLLTLADERNLARFVSTLTLDGAPAWLWEGEDAQDTPLISPKLSPFPALASLVLESIILSELGNPNHIHPLDDLLPQLHPIKPFTLTLVTFNRPTTKTLETLPLRYRLLHPHYARIRISSQKLELSFGEEVPLPPNQTRASLHQALGFSSPPWTTSLDTLVVHGHPRRERPGGFSLDPYHIYTVAGSTWSFRRLVYNCPPFPPNPLSSPARPRRLQVVASEIARHLYYLGHLEPNPSLPSHLEKIDVIIEEEQEAEVRRLWTMKEGRFGQIISKRIAKMVRFLDEGDEEGAEGRRSVEE